MDRLIDRHGEANYLDCTLKLTFPTNPNGVYLLKGGGPEVWRKFGVPSCWRKPQGLIHGKPCGVHGEHWCGCTKAPEGATKGHNHSIRPAVFCRIASLIIPK